MEPELNREELRAKTHMINPAMWVLDSNLINENQKLFEFSKHRFMLQPYSDSSPDQVIMKSAQVGWSVAAILKSIHAANFLKLNVIYVLPTKNVVNDFVRPKVNPMIDRNPEIRKMVKGDDSVSLKNVGDRWIYFRGAFTEKEAISTTADLIVADEYDRCDQGVLTVYQSRLQASDYGWFWRFSNPSIPGFGVHELYQDSDQMHWFVTCGHCGHEWFMDFEKGEKNHYIDEEREVYACGSCNEELMEHDRQKGRWLPRFPQRGPRWVKGHMIGRRGYWLSQLMIPWVSARKILQQKASMNIEVFHNFVLGLPYQASEFLINRESVLRACQPALAEKRDVIIGCDSGKEKHWVMGNPSGIFSYGKTTDWEDIERLITMYNATAVIDALPDFTIPEQLSRKYPGRVYVHYYSPDNSTSMEVSKRKEGMDFGVLQSDRTKLFDLLAADVTSGKMRFFQEPKDLEDLIKHVENVYRVVVPDTRGIPKARWLTKENKPDHWCISGDSLIKTLRGDIKIKNVQVGDYALTSKGYRRVSRAWMTKKNAAVNKYKFSNGAELIATPNHKVATEKGFVELHALAYSDRIKTWQKPKQLFFKALYIVDIQIQKIEAIEFTLPQEVRNGARDGNVITKSFGYRTMAASPWGLSSITKTTILSTTPLVISSLLKIANTVRIITWSDLPTQNMSSGTGNTWTRFVSNRMLGWHPKRGSNTYEIMRKKLSIWKNQLFLTVLDVVRRLLLIGDKIISGVQKPVAIVSTPESLGKRNVYNLTVEGEHEYYANGILVSNCHALAYFRVGQSFSMGPDSAGGVRPSATRKSSGIIVDSKHNTVSTKNALGMDFDAFIERSLVKNKRRRVT